MAQFTLASTVTSATQATSYVDIVSGSQSRMEASDASGPIVKRNLKIDFVTNGNWHHFDSHALHPGKITIDFGLWSHHSRPWPN
jgi:hypothetical protein